MITVKPIMSQFIEQLVPFQFSILQIRYLPLENLTLDKHPSMILRGNLGNQLLTMACLQQGDCKSDGQCQQAYDCLYGKLFQTKVPKDSTILRHQQSAPRPFVFDFPEWILEKDAAATKRCYTYSPDKPLEFNLILFGQALEHLTHIIFALDQFGRKGLYDKTRDERVPIILEQIDSLDSLHDSQGTRLFSGAVKKVFDSLQILNAKTWLNNLPTKKDSYSVHIDFLSPTQLKYKKNLLPKPSVEALIRGLLRRLMGLSYVHCQTPLDIDAKALISSSQQAVEKHNHIQTSAMGHYSKRQRQSVYLGGFYGTINFDNVAASLLPLLRLGEILHVGKSTVYGLGKMSLRMME